MTLSIIDNEVDYAAQEAPFDKWEQIKQQMDEVIHKPDPEPTDWLDELERVREAGRVWVLEQSAPVDKGE